MTGMDKDTEHNYDIRVGRRLLGVSKSKQKQQVGVCKRS